MKKILVIEDQPQMRQNVCTILEMEGYTALAAPDGEAGLALAQAELPDLILCDIMMPKLDGHGVLLALRSERATSSIPFIFLTAKGEKPDVRTGMNLGADDYLPKPVSRADLLAAIEARAERRQQQRADVQTVFQSPGPLESLGLTPREAEVLFWLAQGKANGDIAVILEMTTATAKKHVLHIFEKIGVESRTAASLRAVEVLSAAG
jgi:DNA-binding NarL/FixJ family response regulator